MHDGHVGQAVGRGGHCAQIADRAHTQKLLEDRIARDVLGWGGSGQGERIGGLEQLGDWKRVKNAQDRCEGATAGAGGPDMID